MPQGKAGERATNVRVGSLAVTENRKRDHAVGARPDPKGVGIESGVVERRWTAGSAAVEQAGQPGDGGPGRVDPGLGRERTRDHVWVVGDREDLERRGNGRVEAGRRAGHLADRPRGDDSRAEGTGLAVRATDHDRQAGRQPDPTRHRRAKPADHGARRPDLWEERRFETEIPEQAPVPFSAAEVVDQGGGGMGPVGGHLAGQRQRDQVPRLERDSRALECVGLVGPQPEQLGRDVEARRDVAGPGMDGPRAVALQDCLGLASRPVVAVDQTRRHGAAPSVNQDDRRALPREPDRPHILGPTDAVGSQAGDEIGQGADPR